VFKLKTAYRHARSEAQITFRATSPDGVAQLDVEVTAVDEEGYQIPVILNLKFSKKP
jgi:hypothetical protein